MMIMMKLDATEEQIKMCRKSETKRVQFSHYLWLFKNSNWNHWRDKKSFR